MAYEKDRVVQSLQPLIETEIRATQADSNAIDAGLDAAFEKLSAQNVELETPVVAVDSTPTATESFAPNPFQNLSGVETGVVSPTPSEPLFAPSVSSPSSPEPEEVPTPEPVGMSSAGKARWKALDQANKQHKREVREKTAQLVALQAQNQQLQAQLSSNNTQLPEQIVHELKALREFRDVFGIENHSEFVKEYDNQIAGFAVKIGQVLMNRGMPRLISDARALAEKEGKTEVGISVEALVNTGYENIDPVFWDTSIFPNISGLERRQIEDGLVGIMNTKEARQKAIQEALVRRDAYLQQAEQIQKAQFEQEKNMVYAELEEYYKIAPWAKRYVPTGTETPEVKAKIDAYNKQIDKYEMLFTAAYRPANIKQRIQTAVCAVLVERQSQEIGALRSAITILQQKLAEKDQKINGIKAATTVRQNTVTTPKANNRDASLEDLLKMNDRDAVEAQMKKFGV
jgi:hypothetical protein